MMYKFCFYVPVSDADQVKSSVFAAGAGKIGNYDSCCWQVQGKGQFRPLKGSHPTIGSQDQIEYVDELRVEMVVEDKLMDSVLEAFKKAHPYEEPAYDILKIVDK